jgi:hypothetical protein
MNLANVLAHARVGFLALISFDSLSVFSFAKTVP